MLKTFWLLLTLFFVITLNRQLSNWLLPGYSVYDIKRILEIILLLWTSGYLLVSTANRQAWLNLWQQLPYLARLLILSFFALGLFSTLLAPLPIMALLEVSISFLLFAFSIFIGSQRAVAVKVDKILLGIIIIGLVVYEITFLYTHDLGFVNRRFLNQYLIWVLPLVTLSLTFIQKKHFKIIIYLIAICAWIIAFADFAKGMIISLLLAYLITFFIFKQKAKTWLLTQLTIFGISVGIAVIGYFFLSTTLSLHFMGSIINRLHLWQQALHLIVTHPLLGAGPMHYAYYPNKLAAHPHNSLLLLASEWGLLAMLAVLVLFIWGLSAWLKAYRKNPQPITIALTTAFIAGSCYSLVSGVIITPLSQIMLCIVVGWMLGIYCAYKKPQTKTTATSHIIFICFLIFAMIGIVIGIIPTILYLPTMEYEWILKTHKLIFNPRFWLQGWLR